MTEEHKLSACKGLTLKEVEERQTRDGFNELPSSKPKNAWTIALGVVKEPMFLLLVACGTLYLILGDIQEGIMLLGFVFVIMGIEFYQEKKTEKALDALKDLASPRALVIRNGKEVRIAGRDVVVGDALILQEGDRVPADATVCYASNLLADESLLTGESVPVRKIELADSSSLNEATQPDPLSLHETHPGGDNRPYVYSGSMIVQGHGIARVTAIGMKTELGKIGKALDEVQEKPTRLHTEMGVLIKRLTILGIMLCVLVIGVYFMTRGDLLQGFLAGLTLAMAMLPEEFPVVLTVFLALGAWRISKNNVLTRKPAAIETLGSTTVLCTDKTGTLTQNKMTVSALHNGQNALHMHKRDSFPEEFHEIIEYGILSSQVNPFDPMERAITRMGQEHLEGTEHLHTDWEMIKEYPLSKELLAMSRVYTHNLRQEMVIAAKGAPEAIFDLCHLDAEEVQRLGKEVEKLASKGLRVLGVAKARIEEGRLPEAQHDFAFTFIGLIGLSDPIRKNVPEAVAECQKAGIKVIMITGDYPVTAMNIAREIGLPNYTACITGAELATMNEQELSERIQHVNVFARVIPEQKLKIVKALQLKGEVVAMTGDGVNDAPALKAADIGVAMGAKGTDVAREASSLVLMDDNFASIGAAVKMGRRIFDNLQKALGYIFAIHVPIAGLSLIPVFFADLPLILWPVHIVFLELIIDPACSIIFEAEPAEPNVMNRPPRALSEPFFGARKIGLSCFQGINILCIAMAVYLIGLELGYQTKEVRSMTFITLIVSNIMVIFTNRSWRKNIFQIIATPNTAAKWVVGGAVFFLILIVTVPFLQNLFQFGKITPLEALISMAAGCLSIAWFEWYKIHTNRKAKRQTTQTKE